MKKFFNSFKFILKAFLLVVILLLGWAFINIANLIKGKKTSDKDSLSANPFGTDEASADAPGPGPGSCPFVACFDGKEYKLENDILFGRPKSYWPTYETAKSMYEDGRISPDLYKITSPIKPHNGKLLFQIQEIEPEESFFKLFRLKRVLHPKNTEVVVDSEFKKYYILPKSDFLKSIILPSFVKDAGKNDKTVSFIKDRMFKNDIIIEEERGVKFQKNEEFYFSFKGLDTKEIPYLLLSSWHRDWKLGLEEEWVPGSQFNLHSLVSRLDFSRIGAGVALIISAWISGKWGGVAAAAAGSPIFFGVQGTCSFAIEYKDRAGTYSKVTVTEARAWKYNTEIIEIPRDGITLGGELELRIRSSKRHVLGFIGMSQKVDSLSNKNYQEELLPLIAARHNRLGKDVSGDLKSREGSYVHTIPGDTIDLEFSVPEGSISGENKETYLIQSSGFYTSLRPENQKLAGDWKEKISEEAKERLKKLVSLNSYK